jgi:hypothetical protein
MNPSSSVSGVDWLIICARRLGRNAIDVVQQNRIWQGRRKGLDAILRGISLLMITCDLLSLIGARRKREA